MIENIPSIYLPMDRCQALARGQTLPERSVGTALFADISGFTPLTEALTQSLGARRGAEELTRQLNEVYDALIAQVDVYEGSIIGFSGDAITCWFDGAGRSPDHAPLRAMACSQAMQRAMQAFASVPLPGGETVSLSVKTALATGPVRRFLVGDPQVHVLDALAGETLQRMSHAEHVANRGEIVADEATTALLAERVHILEWRTLEESGKHFAVLAGLKEALAPHPWQPLPPLTGEQVRPWLLDTVYERLRDGLGDFLTELRPAVAVFLRFAGIDYDNDEAAAEKLNNYVVWVQSILTRYDGILVDITIGDKGSYLYASFGAPIAHEDDARRAVSTALELCGSPLHFDYITPVQIGVSRGIMRTGACGGTMRRTYAVLGDEVNLAARLMQNAQPGTALVSRRVQVLAGSAFAWEELPPLRVKGKSQPVQVARPLRETSTLSAFTEFHSVMVGRDAELAELTAFAEPIFNGRFAGLTYVHGEPGMGKSRLLYEFRKALEAEQDHFCRWLLCPAEQILRQSLYPFRLMLRTYFGIDPKDHTTPDEQKRACFDTRLNDLLEALALHPDHADLRAEVDKRRSFLGALLDLHWPGSLYEQFEPKLRFENTLAVLKALILAESVQQPVIVHLEDAHLLDDDSQQFINLLTQGVSAYRFAILVSCRYRDDGSKVTLKVSPETPQHEIDLNRLTSEGVHAMVGQALRLPPTEGLLEFLMEKTEGNPFFVEQLALDLKERGLLTEEDGALHVDRRDLPDLPVGVTAVLVSRLDRLDAHVKAIVQIASVVGHEFDLRILAYMLWEDAHLTAKVKQAETEAIWAGRSEADYLFRHMLLREAAYNMQLYQHVRQWHGRIGEAVETLNADRLSPQAASLSYHFGRAEDRIREYKYSRMAGEYAIGLYANAEAARYLTRAIELVPEPDKIARYELLLLREKVYDLQGARQPQSDDLQTLATLAELLDSHSPNADNGKQLGQRRTEAALRRAQYAEVTGDYTSTAAIAQQAIQLAQQSADPRSEASAHYYLARALWRQTSYEAARRESDEAITLARQGGAPDIEARTVLILGNIAYAQNNYGAARTDYELALSLRRALGDRQGEGIVLGNLGNVAYFQGDLSGSANFFEQNLQLSREIGDRRTEGIALSNLGNLNALQGAFEQAQRYYEQAVKLNRATGDRRSENITLNNLSEIALKLGDFDAARTYNDQAVRLAGDTGDRQNEITALAYRSMIAERTGAASMAYESAQTMLHTATEINQRPGQARALTLIGHSALALDRIEEAADAYQRALAIRHELNQSNASFEPVAGLARAALLQNRPAAAVALLSEIIDNLQHATSNAIDSLDDPFRVYWTAWQTLRVVDDDRANSILQVAITLLHEQADQITDETARQLLENVPVHRELLHAWANRADLSTA